MPDPAADAAVIARRLRRGRRAGPAWAGARALAEAAVLSEVADVLRAAARSLTALAGERCEMPMKGHGDE